MGKQTYDENDIHRRRDCRDPILAAFNNEV